MRACRILASACLIALFYAGPAAGGEGEQPATKPEADAGWRALFDGRTLAGWERTRFGDRGEARVESGRIVLSMGDPMNGVRWTGKFPGLDYEIRLEAMRLEGSDFFCGLTFPVQDSCASLILGGWGGGVCGISSLDGMDASENETTTYRDFEKSTWYPVRLRVTRERIEAWLGEEKIVNVDTAGRRIDVRHEIAPSRPLGLATWRTAAALRNIRWRPLGSAPEVLDLTAARVVSPERSSGPEEKAVAMLVEEAARRSGVRWPVLHEWPAEPGPVVFVGRDAALSALARSDGEELALPAAPRGEEGYRLATGRTGKGARVLVVGNDARGVLFGAGRLLRELSPGKGTVGVPSDLALSTAPRYPLRGHQLGYRPKTNSYDGWSLPVWEQYIRDLAVFGANAVELIPPRSDDAADSPHFPLPPLEMMEGMSRLLDAYGLDVWIWYPAMDPDYSDPRIVESALAEWGAIFQRLPRIDAVFVPGGDPGHTRPRDLMALLEKEAGVLRRRHPRAQMWVSPQGFTREWLDEFLLILKDEPAWLTGVVYGPQVRGSLASLRARVPARYPIRHYPDITHCRQCQFPVQSWDVAFAVTLGREPINPRPEAEARIFRHTQESTVGFITYSEGANDDVNKVIWSCLGWDPEMAVLEILRQYGRYFVGGDLAQGFARGLLDLERNWAGPLLANRSVYDTLERFQALERAASPETLANWRVQAALYRAYYDAYVRSRLIHETALEDQAMGRLREAARLGSLKAMAEAGQILERATSQPVSADWRARVFELAEALFRSIRFQFSVERYGAIDVGRGASLDTIDAPLNSRRWLEGQFEEIRKLPGEAERLQAIYGILHRTDPGPGGFYDDLGDPGRQPRLVPGPGFEKDPGFLESPLVGFGERTDGPLASWHHAEALQDGALRMRYDDLDPALDYKVRVVYGGDSPSRTIRLTAGEELEVHPFMKKPWPPRPLEFDLPRGAVRNGVLELRWTREPGLGGNGRGCQVSEVWLLRATSGNR